MQAVIKPSSYQHPRLIFRAAEVMQMELYPPMHGQKYRGHHLILSQIHLPQLQSVTGLVQGVYQFQLTVTDNDGATGTDVMQVTVNTASNQAPTADAGSNKTITLPTSTVNLSGSGSDADGTISSYAWTKISGPSSYTIADTSSAVTSVTGLVQGVYQFQLTVTDNDGATGTDVMQVTVNTASNQAPTADAGNNKTITLPTSTVNLSGSGSDADGTISSYAWTKISGPSSYAIADTSAAVTSVTELVEGIYKFQLTVTDNKGATGTDVMQVTVSLPAVNQAPIANAGNNKRITLPVNSISLSGSGSDIDGTVSSYKWTKVSGPSSYNIVNPSLPSTQVTGLVEGVYQFELKVTDNDSATGNDVMQVIVNPAVNQAPNANAGSDKTIILPANTASLSGNGSDTDGTIVIV